tara:strand:- start:8930 stop:9163 length:234 start_codon:yes stop_codon:yes gene_type:complete
MINKATNHKASKAAYKVWIEKDEEFGEWVVYSVHVLNGMKESRYFSDKRQAIVYQKDLEGWTLDHLDPYWIEKNFPS